MNNFQTNPVKLYVQDVFRAKRTEQNKYLYQLFGFTFKNVMLHGVVTCVYNNYATSTNLELTDATGSIQAYFDSTKNNSSTPDKVVKNLAHEFPSILWSGSDKVPIMKSLKDSIFKKKQAPINFTVGSYVCIVGDIFVDDLKGVRMISVYECPVTSVQRDLVWIEELKYLYEKYYLRST